MVSGFREKDKNWKKLHKIINTSIENRGSTLILTKSRRGNPRTIRNKFATNPCIGFRNKDRLLKE